MTKTEPHITEIKKSEVESIKQSLSEYKVMGIVNLENLPAFNYMKIRHSLRGKVALKYTKKRLMKIAFDETKDEGLIKLKERLIGIPALIFTNEEPFKLAQILKRSKSNAPAKAGDIAPVDIVIPAGPTDFTPGPMIGELGSIGIKTQVENGKITIRDDKLLVKAGEEINDRDAGLMGKMKMEPMKIGLNLVLTFENGEVMEGIVLNIDPQEYEDNVKVAAGESIALAMFLSYVSKDTIIPLISKASLEAESLKEKSNFEEQSFLEKNADEEKQGTKSEEVKEETKIEEQPVEEKQEIAQEVKIEEQTEATGEEKIEEKAEEPKQEEVKEESKSEEKPEASQEEKKDAFVDVPGHIEKEIEKEIQEEVKDKLQEPENIEEKSEEKKEIRGVSDINQDDIQKAQDALKDLTNKKIRGEI